MSRRTRTLVFLISTPLVLLVVVGGLVGATRTPQRGVPHLKVFEDVISLIVNAYVEDVNVDRVMDGAMRGLSDGLDTSSAYLTPDEVRAVEANAPLPAGDVGLTVTRQFYLRVLGVREGSPAARAGLTTGDFIRAIDDAPARDMSSLAGARRLRGAVGSKVSLVVIRGNAADPHVIELTRERIAGPPNVAKRLPSGEAYVRINSFTAETASALMAAVQSLNANAASSPGIIVDVRGVADGTPADGIAAARLFVKSGTIATRAGRNVPREVSSPQTGDGALTLPLVLLVSNGTANAAEIFAAALADNKRATLVGEPTAGIAGAQRLVKLPDGHGLWLTYARYLRADGSPIHERGLAPDVAVETPVTAFGEAPLVTDPVLTRAAETLSRRPAATP